MNIYKEHGYDSRQHYLLSLAEEHDVPELLVSMLADLLGPSEDFDGLVSTVKGHAGLASTWADEDVYA